MVEVLNFYLDDSGIRYPTHKRGTKSAHGYDWFSLGGVISSDADEELARKLHANFCSNWNITYPLHSSEIRSQNANFLWLRSISKNEQGRFYEELYLLLRSAPLVGIACVIDRSGYNARYLKLYEEEPWLLCKTAFVVAVERAAKYARTLGKRIRIAPERCNKLEDGFLKSYYESLKTDGMPFASNNSGKYAPLSKGELAETLYGFRTKAKSSPMAQFADLYLWPICMGGYHASNHTYRRLFEDGKLIENRLREEDWAMLATKYSCFENIKRKP